MKIKFQADADLSYTIIKALRRRQPAISLLEQAVRLAEELEADRNKLVTT